MKLLTKATYMQNSYPLDFVGNKYTIDKAVYKVDEVEERKAKARIAAKGMIADEIDVKKTIYYLIDAGHTKEEAIQAVENIERTRKTNQEERAQRKMVVGALWVMVGMLLSVFSSQLYFMSNSSKIIFAGLSIIYGTIHFIKGASLKRNF